MSDTPLDLAPIRAREAEYSHDTINGCASDSAAHELAWDAPALIAEVERLRGGVAELRNACHIGSRANPDREVRLVLAEMLSDLDAVLGGAR